MTRLTCALGPDAAGSVLMRLLRDARRSIDAAMYEVGPSYAWALARAAERGVRVRLVLDAHSSDGNSATALDLVAAGGDCRVAGVGADAAHGKLLIVDATVAVGTGNLIWRDAPRDRRLRMPPAAVPLAGTREWWATASGSQRLRVSAAEAFEAHWSAATAPPAPAVWAAAPGPGAPIVGTPKPQVAPATACLPSRRLHLVTGGADVARAFRSMVARASRRVLVTVPYAHAAAGPVRDLLDRMIAASSRGAACGLLLGGVPATADAQLLAALPFPVRRMDPARSTSGHAKGVVADGSALVSSANWSGAGLGGNWEIALRIDAPAAAAYYAAAWRRDWQTGVAIDV